MPPIFPTNVQQAKRFDDLLIQKREKYSPALSVFAIRLDIVWLLTFIGVLFYCSASFGQLLRSANGTVPQQRTVMRPIHSYPVSGQTLRYNQSTVVKSNRIANPYERFQGKVSAIESNMIQDAMDNQFDHYSLFEAALIAAGVTDSSRLEAYKQQYQQRFYQLSRLIPQSAQPIEKARIILEFLHREMFREYMLESSNIGAIFDSGIYNCVTGATLFNSFARQFGLNAVALELPGHAMSRVYLQDETHYDVETTCAIWFELQDYPGKQEQVIARMLEVGAASQIVDAPVVRRQINDVELVAKLYYNRGVELLNKDNFQGAMNCNAKALTLDPKSATARGNFLATLNNWAINESKSARYDVAMNILRNGMRIAPEYPIFKNNHIHIYHQWIEQLCKQSRYEEALELSRQAISEAPNEEHFRKLEAYALMGVQRTRANTAQPSQPVTTTVAYPHP